MRFFILLRNIARLTLLFLAGTGAVVAEDLTALARFDAKASSITMAQSELVVDLALSQPVPFRVFTLTNPARLVADFRQVDWGGVDPAKVVGQGAAITARFGQFRGGWSRLVVDLQGPMVVKSAIMSHLPDGRGTKAIIRLKTASIQEFSEKSGAPQTPVMPATEPARKPAHRKLVVVLDPGHGGIDPGAERDGVKEADLVLGFARILKDELLRSGHFEVVLTRDRDEFIPLETRVSIARAANADVFIALHADILEIGAAAGATVYTLSEKSADEATALLVERHDRGDVLAGVDLAQSSDQIAKVLIDLARIETAPRSEKLADELVVGLRASIGRMHRKPKQSGAFAVLKAADFPSVLIELGFMSDDADFANLRSAQWRARAALGIRIALEHWAVADAALAKRMRN